MLCPLLCLIDLRSGCANQMIEGAQAGGENHRLRVAARSQQQTSRESAAIWIE